MAVNYNEWAAATSYSVDDRVSFDGVIYEANTAITGNTANTDPSQNPDDWNLVAVERIQSEHSLHAAVRLELNTTDARINDSIPLFVQLTEASFQTRIRAPIQRCRVTLPTDDESKITVPSDLLQVINMRIEDVDGANSGGSLINRGGTEILAGNYEEWKDLQRYYRSTVGFTNRRSAPSNYDAPVYWYDSAYFWIAPDLEENTDIELYYYAAIPQLGTTVFLVDANGNAINAGGQTLSQWVADGNDADDFVQDTDTVTSNWFIQAAPQMILYGSLLQAESYLNDDARLPMWQQRFERAELETHELISRFETGRHHTQQIYNAYSQ